MAKDKSEKKAKKESKAVAPQPSKSDLKKSVKAKPPVHSSKEILGNGSGKGKGTTVKAAKPPPPPKESSEESSEDSSEDEVPKVQKTNGKAPAKATMSSDSSSDSSEDEKPKASQVKQKVPVTEATSSSSSEDEVPTKPAPKLAPQAATTAPKGSGKVTADQPSSSSSESSDSDSGPVPAVSKPVTKASTAAPKGAVLASKAVASARKDSDSSDSSSDSESSDSDSSSESGEKSKLVGTKVSTSKAKTSESSSDSDSDDDEDVKMADATTPAVPNGKRKAEDDGPAPIKKAKVSAPSGDADGEESKTLFVGQLSWNVDNDWLSNEFADAGDVVSARVQMDRQSGRSRGFGYVEFATASAAQSALEKFQGKEIDGRAIKLDLSTPRQPNPAARAKQFGDVASAPSSTLFVGNISWNTTEDMLWEHFGQYGEVSSVRVPTDRESGKPKGFGYIEFSDIESAKKGYEGASGSEIDGRFIRLDYSQPRDSSGGGGGGGGFGGRGSGGRGRGGDRGGRGGGRGFGDRGRGGGRGRGGDRGGRGGGRGGPRGGGARTGGITSFAGKKTTFD